MTATTMTAAAVPAERTKAVTREPRLLARIWASFIENRMRQAEREIMLHRHLLPPQFELAGDRLASREKDLPFAS